MIPKIIHYCWFGGNPLSELAQNVFLLGKSIFQNMKLKNGMNQILITVL